jgi:hypothetical protein
VEAFIMAFVYSNGYNPIYTGWASKFGGSGDDYATGITTDTARNLVVAGFTTSTNIPLAHADSAYYQSTNSGGTDGFILKFTDTHNLLNATYYGGSGNDYFTDVVTGYNGNFDFTGRTNSPNFPLRNIGGYGFYQPHLADTSDDAFIVKCANNLTMKWSTYYGGNAQDAGTGIATDKSGQMYVSGFTFSTNFPVDSFTGAFYQPVNHGNSDGFIARFSDLGVRSWSTYKGDSCYQYPYEIAYDRKFNKFYVAGEGLLACGQSLPDSGEVINGTSSVGFCWAFNGQNTPPCTGFGIGVGYDVQPCPGQCNGVATVSVGGGHQPYNYKWSNGGDSVTESNLCPAEGWVEVQDSLGCFAEAELNFNPISVTVAPGYIVCFPGPAMVTATATGGNGAPDLYQWSTSPGTYSDSTSIFVSDTGTYTVIAEDSKGCTATGSNTVSFTNYYTLGELEVIQYPSCVFNQDGIVTLDYQGTSPDFPNGNVEWTDAFYDVLATGDTFYSASTNTTYYAIDSGYCYNGNPSPVYYQFNLPGSTTLPIMQTSPPSSCISSDGQASVDFVNNVNTLSETVTGNVIGYTYNYNIIIDNNFPAVSYQWSDAEGTQSVSDLPIGPYSVTVTDNNCQTVLSGTLTLPTPQVSPIIDSAYCNGGYVIPNPYGGNGGPYTYQWPDGGTGNYENLSPGNYTITITDQLYCADTVTVFVPLGTPLAAYATVTPPLCNGGNATVTITGSAGWPEYFGTGTFLQAAGTHNYYISDVANCNASVSVTVTDPPLLVVAADSIAPASCGGGEATYLISATGGTPPYTGSGTRSEPIGTDVITVYDANGCTGTTTITVHPSGAPIIPHNTYTPILCYGGNTTLTITATGGNGLITGTGVFNKTAGTYYFTISDSAGCSLVDTVVIGQPGQLTVSLSSAGITCSPGTVTAAASGGSPLYMFQWSTSPGNYVSNSFIAVTDTGTYNVTVEDENLCSAAGAVNVGYHNVAANANLEVIRYPTCGNNDGVAALTNQTGNVSWWTSNLLGNIGNFISAGDTLFNMGSGPGPGYVAIDSGSCFDGTPAAYYLEVPFDVDNVVVTDTAATTCVPANGSARITVYSPLQILFYGGNETEGNIIYNDNLPSVAQTWSNGDTSRAIYGLSAGTYTVTLTDGSCQNVQSVTVTGPPLPVILPVVNSTVCYGGTIDVSNVTGNAPYSFLWSNGSSANALTGLSTGSYIVTVTDHNHCSVADTFSIISLTLPIVANNVAAPILCYGDTTTLTITATGGNGTLTGTGVFTKTAGTYYFTISDSAGCSTIDTVVIGQPAQLSVSLSETDITCYSGSAKSFVQGGTQAYSYQWSVSFGNFTSNDTLSVSTPGDYEVTVQDANGCTASAITYVNYNNSNNAVYQLTCEYYPNCDTTNGIISINDPNPSDITWGYDAIGPPVYTKGDTLRDFADGSYGFIAIDSANCYNGQPTVYDVRTTYGGFYDVNMTPPTGCNTNDGKLQISTATYPAYQVTYGVDFQGNNPFIYIPILKSAPLVYKWANGNGVNTISLPRDTIVFITLSSPGIYSVSWTNTFSCQPDTITDTLTPTNPPLVANYSVTSPTCTGNNNGQIKLLGLTNNVPNIDGDTTNAFLWFNGATTASISNLAAGTYSVSITGPNACPVLDTFQITAPPVLVEHDSVSPPLCAGGNGTIIVTASGGTSPYTGTGTLFKPAGTYVITVTDSNGCTASDSVVIHPSGSSSLTVTNNTTPVLCNGDYATLTISATGGTSPYTGTGTYSKPAGDYVFIITDNAGCSATDSIVINQPAILVVTKLVNPVPCYGGDATITLTGHGGTAPYTGLGTFSNPAGNYVFVVTDANGCSSVDSIDITQPTRLSLTDTVTSSISCFGGHATVILNASGGTAPYYGTGTLLQPAGNDVLIVSDQNGCSDSVNLNITQPSQVNINIQLTDTTIHCADTIRAIITATGGTGNYTGTGSITYTHSGAYNITVSDGSGCTIDTTVHITLDTCTGIDNVLANTGIMVYPNPASDMFYVKFLTALNQPADVRLYAVDGKLVMLKTLGAGTDLTEMDCTQLASGVYILRTVVMDEEYNFKVVVTR